MVGWVPTGWELAIILIIGLLLFGRRLPEVAVRVGKGVPEFARSQAAAAAEAVKCNLCSKTAILHITEVTGPDTFEELHLCPECWQQYEGKWKSTGQEG